jgi:hypothetical protein
MTFLLSGYGFTTLKVLSNTLADKLSGIPSTAWNFKRKKIDKAKFKQLIASKVKDE